MDNVKIYDTLKKLAISPACKGYVYIQTALEILHDERDIKLMALYATIAKMHNSTPHRVERCLRTIVMHGLNLAPFENWHEIFGNNVNKNAISITNGDFLHGLYRYLEVQQ